VSVPLDRIDLRPPIGYGKGLPLTLPLHTSGHWETRGATADYADADTSAWTIQENTNIPKAFSATWSTGRAIYDSARGWIFTSQIIAGQAPAPFSVDSDNAFTAYGMGVGITYTMPGRTRGHKSMATIDRSNVTADPILFSNVTLGDGSAPPGNHTHQVGPIEQIASAMLLDNDGSIRGSGGYGRMYDRLTDNLIPPSHDVAIGTKLSVKANSESASITYHSQACLPSGGNGRQWGDAHDTIYNVSLGSSALGIHLDPQHSLYDSGLSGSRLVDAAFKDPVHWAVNLYSQGHYPFCRVPLTSTLPSGASPLLDNPSSPPGIAQVEIDSTPDGGGNNDLAYYRHDMANWMQPSETAHVIALKEVIGEDTVIRELGAAHRGCHTVMDSVGLIGYEGVFVASAFFAFSDDVGQDESQNTNTFRTFTDGMHFAGLNIQVTSGSPARRGGYTWLPAGMRAYRYGSDGAVVRPMSDSMRTTGSMLNFEGSVHDPGVDQNASTFFSGRTGIDTAPNIGTTGSVTIDFGTPVTMATGTIPNHYILGDTEAVAAGFAGTNTTVGTTGMIGTERIGARWMADYVPTKVKIVPSLIGYTDEVVSPGSSKESAFVPIIGEPATPADITFRKPIVDYHVIVTLAEKPNDISVETAGDNFIAGGRNNPALGQTYSNMDLSDSDCVIMHGIFRINPETLEQVFVGPADEQGAWGSRIDADYSRLNGHDQVMPRHNYNGDPGSQGWGLHQVTPMRPLRSSDWDAIPTFTGIEPGGMYQRGGISHHVDADCYGGELIVAATLSDCSALGGGSATTDSTTGKDWFGKVWRFGQVWDTNPQLPPGKELMLFRYSPAQDPDYPGSKHTSPTDNPIYVRLTRHNATQYVRGDFDSDLHNDRHTSHANGLLWRSAADARREGTDGASWSLHDWVFPRVEIMRYIGNEDTTDPDNHPALYCGSLRIMEDGRMMMAAIHRDVVTATTQYPLGDIGYPLNPDNAYPRCPPGYYYDGTTCQPMMATPATSSLGGHYNPASETDTADPTPSPEVPPSASTPSIELSTVFGEYPTFTKMLSSSHARSLILMWTESPASKGKVVQGRCDFSGTWKSDHAGSWTWSQTFNLPDTWWSGARTAYWYPESGQRAIPMVYGAYPEIRLSDVSLPMASPGLDLDLKVMEGFPTKQHPSRQPMHAKGHLYGSNATNGVAFALNEEVNWDLSWMSLSDEWGEQQRWIRRQYWVPTTYGFTDYLSGSKPHAYKGWSAWSLPADYVDTAWRVTGADFPREGANAVQRPLGGFSSSMGLLAGVDYAPNSGEFLGPTDQHQAAHLVFDLGQVRRYPKAGTDVGTIKGYMSNGTYTSVTDFLVADVGAVAAWMQTAPDSPFSDPLLYGTPLVEGSRIRLPVTLQLSTPVFSNTGLVLNLSAAAGISSEDILIEPHIQVPRNLIDVSVFVPIP